MYNDLHLHQRSFHINSSNITGHHRTLTKYLNDEIKILCLLQFFPEVAQNSLNFPCSKKSLSIPGLWPLCQSLSIPLPLPFPPPTFHILSLFPSLPSPSVPFLPFPGGLTPKCSKGSGGALKLPKWVRVEPGRQTGFGVFSANSSASGDQC